MGNWTGSGPWPRLHKAPGVQFVCIDSCRAHLLSSGQVSSSQLERLDTLLSSNELDDGPVFVVLHYPLRGRQGDAYGPPARAIENAAEVEAVLKTHGPRITAILHGHEHHGYRTSLPYEGGEIPIFNPGASGYAWLPDHGRTAHFNLYTLEGGRVEVERFRWSGDRKAFEPEPGGAYASGG
jgi:3',5'-cyclic AMP phosphodiesterase CpdA